MQKRLFDKITRGSIRFRWVTIVFSVLLLVAGVLSLTQFNQELLPRVEFPQSVVLTFYPGASPQETLDQVTIPIEDAVRQVKGVVYVESNTGSGFSAIIISTEYGLVQEALREEIEAAVMALNFPEEVEPPELLAFSLSDLPLASISVSSSDLTLDELKVLVESDIIPEIESITDVARVQVSGGQELPSVEEQQVVAQENDPDPTPTAIQEPTATPTQEPTATLTEEPDDTVNPGPESTIEPEETGESPVEPEPVPLPESWVQGAAAQGVILETTADLSPEMIEAMASMAPQALDELTPEILLAMPLEALAALPLDFLAGLEPELQASLAERLVPAQEDATTDLEPVALPETWVQGAAAQGLTLETTADLSPELISAMVSVAPQALDELTPEMLLAMPLEALSALPQDYLDGLEQDLQKSLLIRLEALDSEPEAELADESPVLPDSWITMAEEFESPVPMQFETAADLLNNPLGMGVAELFNLLVNSGMLPDPAGLLGDLTPELFSWWSENDPGFVSGLAPETVALFSPQVLALIPPEVLVELEAAAVEAETVAADAPPLPESWRGPDSPFQTSGDILNNAFGLSAGDLLNVVVRQNPESLGDLTPEVILWLAEQEAEFLPTLEPGTLRLLSPEVLTALPADYMDSLDSDLRAELEGIAAGTVEVFLPTETINRTNGQPSLSLIVYKNSEANTVSVTHEVYDMLDQLSEVHAGIRFDVAFEQASFIEESISGVAREGGLGALFAVLVILLFLSGFVNGRYTLSWRSTLVTGVSIPLSVMMGFAFMKWIPPMGNAILAPLAESMGEVAVIGPLVNFLLKLFPTGITLNIMTLSGMTVAVGRVVDDSIVVLENIYRHIQRGENPRQSVIAGTRDVAIPIFASTVTTVVVFLPIGLMGGMIGNFFLPFGMTVTYALGSSFVVAITIVPVLAYLFIRKQHLPAEKDETAAQRLYTPMLKWVLGHRLWTLVVAAAVFVASMWLLVNRPQTFLPGIGESTINVTVDLGNGITMMETDALVSELEGVLAGIEGIKVYQSQIGSSGGMESFMFASGIDQSAANLEISTESLDEMDQLTVRIREEAETVFGADHVTVSAGGLTAGGTSGFDLVVTGLPEELAKIDDEIIRVLGEVDGLVNITSNLATSDVIVRVDGQPAVQYSGEIEGEDTMGVLAAGRSAVEGFEGLPDGTSVSEGYVASIQTEGFQQSIRALMIAIVVVYVVMVATFGSLAHPFVILFSLPLAVVGAAVGLWITDKVVGISAMVGLMMLVGIVVTNAIVLIDRVNVNRKERGMGLYDALVEAGRTRLRPILMTAIAAILALVPLSLGLTEGALIASDLAVVVIGGLTTSTLLTLLVVPVAYSLVESALGRFRRS